MMVFCIGTKKNHTNLMSIFKEYGEASGQYLSTEKCIFYSGSISARRNKEFGDLLGFPADSLPFTYLGGPLFNGKPKVIHLQPITDRVKAKLSSWKGALLSIMGRAQLVNSIINSMLLYSFQI